MFLISNHLRRFATGKVVTYSLRSSQNQRPSCAVLQTITTQNFSSRIRRRRPTSAIIQPNKNTIDEEESEEKRQKAEFQVKDMLESAATGLFVPKNENGEEVTMGEYLKFASLSPLVPCPDAVARRALDIANSGESDVHYELGSGDGRVNFFAIDLYKVKKSVGIDIDTSLVEQSTERIMKRHPAPKNINFVCADLMDESNETTAEMWKKIGEECTVLTMYFVDDALEKVKPLLEKYLLGKQCKILTIGYKMDGWEPKWAEVVLGLTINMYDMNNLDELYNKSMVTDIPEGDEELNAKSRQMLTDQYGDDESNPFEEQRIKANYVPEIDDNMDFDENETYDDDDEDLL
jgi:hypothetical protein